jgi:hypothetical protein
MAELAERQGQNFSLKDNLAAMELRIKEINFVGPPPLSDTPRNLNRKRSVSMPSLREYWKRLGPCIQST